MITRLLANTKFPYLSANVYLIRLPQVVVLVDTGNPFLKDMLINNLQAHDLKPEDIQLVINTHLHFDHCGNNSLFTNAQIFIPADELKAYKPLFYLKKYEALEFFRSLYPSIPLKKMKNFCRITLSHLNIYRQILDAENTIFVQNNCQLLENFCMKYLKGGHTLAHLIPCLRQDETMNLFCGDTILNGKSGDFIFMDYLMVNANAARVKEMGDVIYPGHGDPISLK